MNFKKYIIALSIIIAFLMVSCSKDPKKTDKLEAKPISQIQKEQGYPVKVNTITNQNLESWQNYTSTLNGYNETTVVGLLSETITNLNVKVGDLVKRDQLLAKYASDNAKSQYQQAKINVETLEKTYNRMKAVFETGGLSKQQLDEIEAKYKVAKENFKGSKDLIYITAPITGTVSEVFITDGQKLNKEAPICKITDYSKLKTTIIVNERDILKINKNIKVKLSWEGLPSKVFIAKINKVALSANAKTRGFAVEIIIDNNDNILKPGIFVEVSLRTLNLKNIIIINRNIIQKESDASYVYLVKENKCYKQKITTGIKSGDSIEILAGLSIKDKIVVEGQTLLSDNAKIKIIE